jgi:hypothetical protein
MIIFYRKEKYMTWGNLVPAAAVIRGGQVLRSVVRCTTSEDGLLRTLIKILFKTDREVVK